MTSECLPPSPTAISKAPLTPADFTAFSAADLKVLAPSQGVLQQKFF